MTEFKNAHPLVRKLYKIAMIDGIALLLLMLVAVPLKRMLGMPWGVKVLGPVHGALFLTLTLLLVTAVGQQLIQKRLVILMFVLAFVPFGAFVADYLLKKSLQTRV